MPETKKETFGFAENAAEDETEPGLVPAEQYRDTIGDWTELGDITVEDWSEEDPRPETWPDWIGPEPDWFKLGKRKVVTDADFTKSTLPDVASFAYVKLVNAKFEDTTFEGDASFRCTTFVCAATFKRATVEGEANFEGAKFTEDAYFYDMTFEGCASFRNTIFTGDALFNGITFEGETDFSRSTYLGDVFFPESSFEGRTIFDAATFHGNARFDAAQMAGDADFAYATFTKEVNFNAMTFDGNVNFGAATFNGTADFNEAEFNGVMDFTRATFKSGQKSTLVGAAIKNDFRCRGADLGDLDMKGITIKGKLEISNETNMSKVQHIETVSFVKKDTLDEFIAAGYMNSFLRDRDTRNKGAEEQDDTEKEPTQTELELVAAAVQRHRSGKGAKERYDLSKEKLEAELQLDDLIASNLNLFTIVAQGLANAHVGDDGYKAIVDMHPLKFWKEWKAIRHPSNIARLKEHKDEIEEAVVKLQKIRGYTQLTEENWTNMMQLLGELYDTMNSLIMNHGNRRLVDVLGRIIFDDKKVDESNPDLVWQTPRETYNNVTAIAVGLSKAPPGPTQIAAIERAIRKPFKGQEFLDEMNELKEELRCISVITTAKERVGLLLGQVSLSVLFAATSFMATYIYDLEALENITGVSDDDDMMFTPIVDQLQSDAGESVLQNIEGALQQQMVFQQQQMVNQQQQMANQQQIIQLLTEVLLNITK